MKLNDTAISLISENKQANTKSLPMTNYWLVYLVHNKFRIDVLRKEIRTLTGQCRAGAQPQSTSQAEVPSST